MPSSTTETASQENPYEPPATPAPPDSSDSTFDPEKKPDWRSMIAVLVVQAHNVFNDKISQFMLIGLAGALAGTMVQANGDAIKETTEYKWLIDYELLITIMQSLPFIIFAPIAGWFADRFSKRTALYWCFIIQIVVLAWITVCLKGHMLWWATVGFFFLAIQSTMLSPAKMGVIKELVGHKKIAVASGWMQMLVVLSILIGQVIGGMWFKNLNDPDLPDSKWDAAFIIILVLFVGSIIPFFVMLFMRKTPAQSKDRFQASTSFQHFHHLKELFSRRELRLAGLGATYFWFAGGAMALILIDIGKQLHPEGTGEAIAVSSILYGVIGIGNVLGSVFVALVSRKGVELGLIPMGAVGMAAFLFMASIVPADSKIYYAIMVGLGFFAGTYLVPLNAFIQDTVDPERRGRITSAINLLNAIAGVVVVGFIWILRQTLPTGWHFAILGMMTVAAAIYISQLLPRHFLRFVAAGLVKMIYRVRPLNVENVPKEGGVLMISNHVSYVDAFIISVACPRAVRFVIVDHYLNVKSMAWFLRIFDVIPISPSRAKEAIKTTAEAVQEGSVVCIFPEGQLTRTGMLNELKKGFELIVRQAKAPVLPVYMDSLWGSIFSFERFRYFYKVPKRFPYPVTVNFGELIPYQQVDGANARVALQDLSVDAFAEREDMQMSLGEALVRALKRRPRREAMIDLGKSRRVMTRGVTLVTASGLAKRWRQQWPDDRLEIGVLLPPGAMAGIMNVAIVLAGRVPVNLPLTLIQDEQARRRVLGKHGLQTVVSSQALFGGELPEGFLDMAAEVHSVSIFGKLFGRLATRLEPNWAAVSRLGLRTPHLDEGAVAFVQENGEKTTLSHRNVLASVYQIDSSLVFLPKDRVFLESAFNEVAPALLGLWHPLLKRGTAVYRGLVAQKLRADLILAEEKPEIVILTPNLTQTLTHEEAAEIPTETRVLIDCGSEPLSAEVEGELERNGAEYCPIFALDSLGAIVSMNTKDPNSMIPAHLPQTGNKAGSVGRLMPGVSARVIERLPDGEVRVRKLWDEGELVVRGVALPTEKGTIRIDGHEFVATGRRGHFDRDGFLTLDEIG